MYARVCQRWKRSGASVLVLALLLGASLLGASVVLAQDAELSFQKSSLLTSPEQTAQVSKYLARMRDIVQQVERLAQRARTDKDIIKLNCVNDKLVQIKGSLRVAEQVDAAHKLAVARNDDGSRDHEFAKITIAYQKAVVLAQEAEACIGEEIAYIGATRVDVQVDPDIDERTDPTVEPLPKLPMIRGPVVSPFR